MIKGSSFTVSKFFIFLIVWFTVVVNFGMLPISIEWTFSYIIFTFPNGTEGTVGLLNLTLFACNITILKLCLFSIKYFLLYFFLVRITQKHLLKYILIQKWTKHIPVFFIEYLYFHFVKINSVIWTERENRWNWAVLCTHFRSNMLTLWKKKSFL